MQQIQQTQECHEHVAGPGLLLLEQRRAESRLTLFHRIVHKEVNVNENVLMERNPRAPRKGNSVQFRLQRTVSNTHSFHIPSLSGMLYLQVLICHSSKPKSSLLTCVIAVHSTNHALTAVVMILKDINSLTITAVVMIPIYSYIQWYYNSPAVTYILTI